MAVHPSHSGIPATAEARFPVRDESCRTYQCPPSLRATRDPSTPPALRLPHAPAPRILPRGAADSEDFLGILRRSSSLSRRFQLAEAFQRAVQRKGHALTRFLDAFKSLLSSVPRTLPTGSFPGIPPGGHPVF